MSPTDTTALTHEVHIDAEPETVFAFFTDPDKMIQWKGRRAELDPRPGGVYRVDVTGEHVARGEYVELDPPHRVVFTWGWEGGDAVPPGLIGPVLCASGVRWSASSTATCPRPRAVRTATDGTTTSSGWAWRPRAAMPGPTRGPRTAPIGADGHGDRQDRRLRRAPGVAGAL